MCGRRANSSHLNRTPDATAPIRHRAIPWSARLAVAQPDRRPALHGRRHDRSHDQLSPRRVELRRRTLHGHHHGLHRRLPGGAPARHGAAPDHHDLHDRARVHWRDLPHRRARPVHHAQPDQPDFRHQAHEHADRQAVAPRHHLRLRPYRGHAGADPASRRRRVRHRRARRGKRGACARIRTPVHPSRCSR